MDVIPFCLKNKEACSVGNQGEAEEAELGSVGSLAQKDCLEM
jgi:hypothetical protein